MTSKQQSTIIQAAILATFRQAFPALAADGITLESLARAAANNAAQALQIDED